MAQNPKNYRLNGLHPLAYMGVNPPSPADLTIRPFPPTANDSQNFQLGATWLVPTTTPEQYWVLVNLEQGVATWVQLYPGGGGGGGASSFPTDNGTAAEAGSVLNILGGNNINTSAPGMSNTVQIQLDDNVDIPGTFTLSGFGQGVLQTHIGGGVFSSTGTNGQILIGETAGSQAWANITSNDNSIVVTNGANTIDLSAASSTNPAASCTFFYYQATTAFGVIGGPAPAPIYQLGSAVALTMLYDNTGGAVNPGNGAGTGASFTAPATGVYCIQVSCGALGLNFTAYIQVTGTSAHVYYPNFMTVIIPGAVPPRNAVLEESHFSFIIPMTIGDIAVWNAFQPAIDPFNTTDILGIHQPFDETPVGFMTWISGYRIV